MLIYLFSFYRNIMYSSIVTFDS